MIIICQTSPLGHLHTGDTKFGDPRKIVHIIFVHVFVTSVEGKPLFRGRDTCAGSRNLPHLGDTYYRDTCLGPGGVP